MPIIPLSYQIINTGEHVQSEDDTEEVGIDCTNLDRIKKTNSGNFH